LQIVHCFAGELDVAVGAARASERLAANETLVVARPADSASGLHLVAAGSATAAVIALAPARGA
jgi:hypothetical protein